AIRHKRSARVYGAAAKPPGLPAIRCGTLCLQPNSSDCERDMQRYRQACLRAPVDADEPSDGAVVHRMSQAQRAYRELRRRILHNEMPPNAQYLEQELADSLGMSRTPVREALIRLSDERLVEIRPRHGARILPVSVDDMREIYEMMTELEAFAVRKLARRGLH